MTFHEMLESLGEAMGADVETERDFCAIEVGDGAMRTVVLVHHVEEERTVFLSADLGAPPPERLEGLYKAMLESNGSFGATRGATLGLDPETGHVRCERYDTLDSLAAKGPFAVLEKFARTALEWRRLVAEYREAVASGGAAGGHGMPIPPEGFIMA